MRVLVDAARRVWVRVRCGGCAMSGREWKPGDVALVNDCTRPEAPWKPATCVAARRPDREAVWVLHDGGSKVWGSVSSARPLVLIDPEDREQVARLNRGLNGHVVFGEVQAALRSLIADPKPEEPTGLGAVVEDADGIRWVRRGCPTNKPWAHETMPGLQPWSDLEVVRVLSEGVTA